MRYIQVMDSDTIECCGQEVRTDSIHQEDHMDLVRVECLVCGTEARAEIHTDERRML